MLTALVSCGKETGAPEGMKLLCSRDTYIVYVPERWAVDDSSLAYAHSTDYRLNDKKAFYASVQILEHTLGEKSMDDFVSDYVANLKAEFKTKFNSDAPIGYEKGNIKGKVITYSIEKADGKELYKSTLIEDDGMVIELRYIAMNIDGLYEKNINDYNMIVENIYLK